jgi:hypothetical protein
MKINVLNFKYVLTRYFLFRWLNAFCLINLIINTLMLEQYYDATHVT